MKITLYKNCILSRSYSEVFDCTTREDSQGSFTYLDRYLDGLIKYEFDVDMAYQTILGSFCFEPQATENLNTLYEYCYMKVQDGNFKRYCFIDTIQPLNSIVTVTYSEDIWHSYSGVMTLRESYLTNSLRTFTNEPYYLPLNYFSNLELEPIYLRQNSGACICATLQFYNISTAGKVSDRQCIPIFLFKYSSDTRPQITGLFTSSLNYSYDEISKALNYLISSQSSGNASGTITQGSTTTQVGSYYQIDDIYIIPADYYIQHIKSFADNWVLSDPHISLNNEDDKYFAIYNMSLFSNEIKYNIPNDFKMTSFGFRYSSFDIENNGVDKEITLSVNTDQMSNIHIHFKGLSKIIDVSDALRYEPPYSTVDGGTLAQQKISKTMKTINGATQIVRGGVQMGASIVTGGLQASTEFSKSSHLANVSRNRKLGTQTMRSARVQSISAYNTGIASLIGGGVGAVGGAISTVNGITDIVIANKPQFMNNTGLFTDSIAIKNAIIGVLYYVIQPQNEQIIENIKNEIGYVVDKMVDDNYLRDNTLSINVCKFDFVKLQGAFPEYVKEALKEILINGFKIYYTTQV